MDPYLEIRWPDVRATLIASISEALQPQLPQPLRARIMEIIIDEEVTDERGCPPPLPQIDRFIQIVDVRNGNRVVTAIEILSPWNKAPGKLNRIYQKKMDDYLRAEVSVVEIDLLRSPRGRLKVSDFDLPPERRTPYMVCVRRGWLGDRWEVYSIPLRAPLPAVPVPLRKTDKDVALALQPLIDHAYVAGGHDDIDYSKSPEPPLSDADAAWAQSLPRPAR